MSSSRPKFTRTARHLLGPPGASGNIEALESPNAVAAPPMYRRRLLWETSPKMPYDASRLAAAIVSNPADPYVFLDTSLFDDRTPLGVWDALLSRPRGITIIPAVRDELEPWLQANPGHPATHAIRLRDVAADVRDFDSRSPEEARLFQYYGNLLGVRKKLLRILRWQFEEKNGRPPNEGEVESLKRAAHEALGPRGYMLIKKGEAATGSSNFLTDEMLVVSAVIAGIRTGKPVFILTKDEDVLEQFYQMNWLLETHYRGMLLAKAYVRDPSRFVTVPMPIWNEVFTYGFTGAGNLLLPDTFDRRDEFLPSTFRRVRLHCCVMGDLMSRMTFVGETQMGELLDVKAETGGLNTNLLDGRNCHFWLGGLPLPQEYSGCGAIAFERRVVWPQSTATASVIEVNQATYCAQPFEGVIRSPLLD